MLRIQGLYLHMVIPLVKVEIFTASLYLAPLEIDSLTSKVGFFRVQRPTIVGVHRQAKMVQVSKQPVRQLFLLPRGQFVIRVVQYIHGHVRISR